jgi:hypothetical protein
MKTLLSVLLLSFGFAYGQEVRTWGYEDCEQTMTTDHFVVEPQEEISISLELSGCDEADLGQLVYFGYKTTKNRSRQIDEKDKILLSIDGAAALGLVRVKAEAKEYILSVENLHKNKPATVRLRSSLLQP